MSAPLSRKPRFKRVPVDNIQLTERDLAIIRQVFKHRFLRSTHIVTLLNSSPQMTVRRLQLLYHHGYLDRPWEQVEFYQKVGSRPMAYGLGNRGADLLAEAFGMPRGKIDWTAKNKSVGQIFLNHTLSTADFMVRLEVACRDHGRIRLMEAREILEQAPELTRRRKNPFGWQVAVQHNGERYTLGVIPDKLFGLHYLDQPDGRNRAYFFLEIDRGTMPVFRRSLQYKQTSFFVKLLAYYQTWQQDLHTKHYGIKNFRVLTVTNSRDRVENMLAANLKATSGRGSPLFLFTDEGTLGLSGNPLELLWQSGRGGESVTLLG